MTERIIHLVQNRPSQPLNLSPPDRLDQPPTDQRGRRLRDLRVSVTDRCNFRCTYCMPKSVFGKAYQFLPHTELLSFEEIESVVKSLLPLGIEKIRLTGGEPLLRKNLEVLIDKLSKLKTHTQNKLEIALTTNGTLLKKKAFDLKEAGLDRLTVSLDAIDDEIFKQMNDVDFAVNDVLEGLEVASSAGFEHIKVNAVVQKGVNDCQIVPMAKYFKNSRHVVRFIEFMDVGSSNNWKMDDVIPSAEVIHRISTQLAPLEPVERSYPGEVAQRWRYKDGTGEVGVISSVTQAFCHECTRLRLSTEGKLYTCLFATEGLDIKPLLRNKDILNLPAEAVRHAVHNLWESRGDRYSEIRTGNTHVERKRIEMSYIGG